MPCWISWVLPEFDCLACPFNEPSVTRFPIDSVLQQRIRNPGSHAVVLALVHPDNENGEAVRPRLQAIVAACTSGHLAPNVALMQLISEATSAQEAAAAARCHHATGTLWQAHAGAWKTVQDVLHIAREGGRTCSTPADWARIFDAAAAISPDLASALYLFDDAQRSRASNSIVAQLKQWRLLTPAARVLDFGCGSGRVVEALAQAGHSVVGVDISDGMLAAARHRCAGLPGIELLKSDGTLDGLPAVSFDVLLACDVLPYLVSAGVPTVRQLFAAAERLITPPGALVIINYSYRNSSEQDLRDVEAYGRDVGLDLVRCSHGDFDLWDGTAFVLVKPSTEC